MRPERRQGRTPRAPRPGSAGERGAASWPRARPERRTTSVPAQTRADGGGRPRPRATTPGPRRPTRRTSTRARAPRRDSASSHRKSGTEAKAASCAPACFELAPVDRDALAHADEAVTASAAVAPAPAVVADRQLDVSVLVAHDDFGPLRPSVLERVRKAFLDEPVGGQVKTGRKLDRLSLNPQVDGQPRFTRVLDEPLDLVEGGLWREGRRLLGSPEHAHHAPHLGERLAPGLLDDEQCLALLLLMRSEQPPRRRSLDGHHAHAVPDDVVQLAGDPRSLVGDREASALLPIPLGLECPLPRLVGLVELAADQERNR